MGIGQKWSQSWEWRLEGTQCNCRNWNGVQCVSKKFTPLIGRANGKELEYQIRTISIHFYALSHVHTLLSCLNWTACADFPNVVAHAPHFLGGGCAPRGLWPSNSNSVEIFVQCTYPPSFTILCLLVWKLSYWQTNTPTHKQNKETDAAENTQCSSLRYDVG